MCQVLTTSQKIPFEYCGVNYNLLVAQTIVDGQLDTESSTRGLLTGDTTFLLETPANSGIKVVLASSIFQEDQEGFTESYLMARCGCFSDSESAGRSREKCIQVQGSELSEAWHRWA